MEDTPLPVDEAPLDQVHAFGVQTDELVEYEPHLPPSEATGRDLFSAVAIAFVIQFFLGVVIGVFSALQNGRHSGSQNLAYMAYLMPVTLVTTFAVSYYYVCAKYQKPFFDGFAIRRLTMSHVLRYVAIGFGLAFAAMLSLGIAYAISPKSLEGKSLVVRTMQNPQTAVLWMIFALCAPLVEELFYRGFAFPVLERRFNTRAALWIVAAWFAGMHLPQIAGDWPSVIGITFLSITVTWLRARTESLTPSILVHFVYNTALVLLSLIARGHTSTEAGEEQLTQVLHLMYRG